LEECHRTLDAAHGSDLNAARGLDVIERDCQDRLGSRDCQIGLSLTLLTQLSTLSRLFGASFANGSRFTNVFISTTDFEVR
jgi:hypothetical protein